MKKKLVALLLILLITYASIQLYYYSKTEANLIFIVSNLTGWQFNETAQLIKYEIYIDDSLIYRNDSLLNLYNIIESKVSIGKHDLTIVADSIIKKRDIYVMPMLWVVLEYPNNQLENNEKMLITTHVFPPKLE